MEKFHNRHSSLIKLPEIRRTMNKVPKDSMFLNKNSYSFISSSHQNLNLMQKRIFADKGAYHKGKFEVMPLGNEFRNNLNYKKLKKLNNNPHTYIDNVSAEQNLKQFETRINKIIKRIIT